MTTLGKQVFECPNCRTLFTATTVMSFGHASRDTDFYPKFWGTNPLPFFVKVCPSCSYADYDSGFKSGGQHESKDLPTEQKLRCYRKYELVAELQEKRKESFLSIARTYQQAGWCCRVVDGTISKMEQVFLIKALDLFKKALKEKEVPEAEMPVITYLVGELYRRTDDNAIALDWFAKVPVLVKGSDKFGWLLRLAENQAAKARHPTSEE
jgi:uncharacterized protein (DUF2225 family)